MTLTQAITELAALMSAIGYDGKTRGRSGSCAGIIGTRWRGRGARIESSRVSWPVS
jgi:hypothetical protein